MQNFDGLAAFAFYDCISSSNSHFSVFFHFIFRLVDDFNGVYEFVTFGYFLWTLSGVCCFVLTLLAQLVKNFDYFLFIHNKFSLFANYFRLIFFLCHIFKKSDNASPAEILTTLIQIGYTFVTLFAACEFGQRVTHQFNQFNEQFYDSNWYLFSLAMQRIYSIVLIGAQDAVIIQGYANTVCTRNAFENVICAEIQYASQICPDFRTVMELFLLSLDRKFWIFLFDDASPNG